MSEASPTWPPLIVANEIPRWVKRRDVLLTLLMWALFAIMLETEFKLFFGPHLKNFGFGNLSREANWGVFFDRLSPFLLTALFLIVLLVLASVATLRGRHRSLSLAAPARLGNAEQARRAGMEVELLQNARSLRIAIVHLDTDGKMRVLAGGQNLSSSPASAAP
jgi:hypothetical protein